MLFRSNPLAPDFEFALKGEETNFQTGLDVLAKLAKTYLNISVKQNAAALTQAKNVTITAFDGPNPAGNVGVQINQQSAYHWQYLHTAGHCNVVLFQASFPFGQS